MSEPSFHGIFAAGGTGVYCGFMIKSGWLITLGFLWLMVPALWADQVVMQNGDTLSGRVVAMNTNVLVLQNENFGAVAIPRTKVASIVFGAMKAIPATNAVETRQVVAPQINSTSDLAAELRGIRGQSNLIQQVESQYLNSAGPDAVNKFNELLDGLSTGKIDMNGLRAQAQSTAEQLRSLTNGMDPDVMEEAGGYLSILDGFLKETAPAHAATNSAAP
jgi:hypothetical protein